MLPISLVNFNIRSFHRNVTNFLAKLVAVEKIPDILILTETWNTHNNVDNCNIENIHTPYDSMRSRGFSLFCGVEFSMENKAALFFLQCAELIKMLENILNYSIELFY